MTTIVMLSVCLGGVGIAQAADTATTSQNQSAVTQASGTTKTTLPAKTTTNVAQAGGTAKTAPPAKTTTKPMHPRKTATPASQAAKPKKKPWNFMTSRTKPKLTPSSHPADASTQAGAGTTH